MQLFPLHTMASDHWYPLHSMNTSKSVFWTMWAEISWIEAEINLLFLPLLYVVGRGDDVSSPFFPLSVSGTGQEAFSFSQKKWPLEKYMVARSPLVTGGEWSGRAAKFRLGNSWKAWGINLTRTNSSVMYNIIRVYPPKHPFSCRKLISALEFDIPRKICKH